MDDGVRRGCPRRSGVRSPTRTDRPCSRYRLNAGILPIFSAGQGNTRAVVMMQPRDLQPGHFKNYAPEARSVATDFLAILKRLPLSFLPSVLREVADYDFKFPAERQAL